MKQEVVASAATIAAALVRRTEPGRRVSAEDIKEAFLLAYRGVDAAVHELAREAARQPMTRANTKTG